MKHKHSITNKELYRSINYGKNTLNAELILVTMTAFGIMLYLYYGLNVVTEKLAQVTTITPLF